MACGAGVASLTPRAGIMVRAASVWTRRYQPEASARVSPCEVLQPAMRPLLPRRAGIMAPGSAVRDLIGGRIDNKTARDNINLKRFSPLGYWPGLLSRSWRVVRCEYGFWFWWGLLWPLRGFVPFSFRPIGRWQGQSGVRRHSTESSHGREQSTRESPRFRKHTRGFMGRPRPFLSFLAPPTGGRRVSPFRPHRRTSCRARLSSNLFAAEFPRSSRVT